MARQMRTSDMGVELIKSFEGFRARASRLPDGRWLIGYGHTKTARAGLRVSAFDAELILRFHDLKHVEDVLDSLVYTPLSQNEFDALASFVFNIGPKAFETSEVLSHLNSGDRIQAVDAMNSWRRGRVDGQIRIIDALVRRRAAEIAMFLDTPGRRVPVPGAVIQPERDALVGVQSQRETAIIVEARADAERARSAQAPARETAPQAAARAVAERLTRILGENAQNASGEPPVQRPTGAGDPTVDEITRAVSALADPDGNGQPPSEPPPSMSERRRAFRATGTPQSEGLTLNNLTLPPADTIVVDDLAPVHIEPSDLHMPPAGEDLGFPPAQIWRWLPFALLAGLGTIGLYDGLRRIVTQSGSHIAQTGSAHLAGPLLTLGGGFLLFVSVYYLYRMLAHEE